MAAKTRSSAKKARLEVVEIKPGSRTEALSSETGSHNENEHESLSLDNLFDELAKETQGAGLEPENEEDDEFTQIKAQLEKLPQIESKLERKLEVASQRSAEERAKNDIIRINDPITHKTKKKDKPVDSGSDWFNMKQPEMTPEIKRDLLIVKQRAALDPKRHYKKDKWDVPKFFQMGTIIEGNTEFYSKMTKRSRGKTMVEELLHDDDAGKYFKRKFTEIQDEKRRSGQNHRKVMAKRKKF